MIIRRKAVILHRKVTRPYNEFILYTSLIEHENISLPPTCKLKYLTSGR
jgi:hypothetical protein